MKRHRGCGVKLEILSSGKEYFNNNVRAEDEKSFFSISFIIIGLLSFCFFLFFLKYFLKLLNFLA